MATPEMTSPDKPKQIFPANCLVLKENEKDGILSYDIRALNLKDKAVTCTFEIQSPEDQTTEEQIDKPKQQVAVFEISLNGEVVRRNVSKPFPEGSLTQKKRSPKEDKKDGVVKVEVKKHAEISLHSLFV